MDIISSKLTSLEDIESLREQGVDNPNPVAFVAALISSSLSGFACLFSVFPIVMKFLMVFVFGTTILNLFLLDGFAIISLLVLLAFANFLAPMIIVTRRFVELGLMTKLRRKVYLSIMWFAFACVCLAPVAGRIYDIHQKCERQELVCGSEQKETTP